MNSTTVNGYTAVQLRNILVDEYGFSKQESKDIKGKKALVKAVMKEFELEQQIDETVLDDLEAEEVEIDNIVETLKNMADLESTDNGEQKKNVVNEEFPPLPSHSEWTDYVLSELTEDEKIKDKNNPKKEYPTTDGLRRLVEKLVGVIVKSNTEICQTPSPQNERRATVVVHIGILPAYIPYDDLLEYSGAADVYVGNSANPFCNHPIATAETKSEGRAYKKALKIKVSTYEEMNGPGLDDIVFANNTPTEGLIKQDQINFIDMLCKRLNIDVQKITQSIYDYDKLTKLPYEDACTLLALLQEYQGDKTQVPEEIAGYKGDWQNNF